MIETIPAHPMKETRSKVWIEARRATCETKQSVDQGSAIVPLRPRHYPLSQRLSSPTGLDHLTASSPLPTLRRRGNLETHADGSADDEDDSAGSVEREGVESDSDGQVSGSSGGDHVAASERKGRRYEGQPSAKDGAR